MENEEEPVIDAELETVDIGREPRKSRATTTVSQDEIVVDHWKQVIVYGAGKETLNGNFVAQGHWPKPHSGPYRYLRMLDDIDENDHSDRFWLFRDEREVMVDEPEGRSKQKRECWLVTKWSMPPEKARENPDSWIYRNISDDLNPPSVGWEAQPAKPYNRPPPSVLGKEWNECYVQFSGIDGINGRYLRVPCDHEFKDIHRPQYHKENVDYLHFVNTRASYFRQVKEPHNIIFQLDKKIPGKQAVWVIASPNNEVRWYVCATGIKQNNLTNYPPLTGWICNPAYKDPEKAMQALSEEMVADVVEDEESESESSQDDLDAEGDGLDGKDAEKKSHMFWPPPTIVNTSVEFKPEFVLSFRVRNFGYHCKLTGNTIEMVSNEDEDYPDWETADPATVAFPPAKILRYLKNARIHYQLRLSSDGEHIFCFLCVGENAAKRWAAYMDHDLLVSAPNAIQIGREDGVNFLLAKRTNLKPDPYERGAEHHNVFLDGIDEAVDNIGDCFKYVLSCILCGFDVSTILYEKAVVTPGKWQGIYCTYSDRVREELYTRYRNAEKAAEDPIADLTDCDYSRSSLFSPRHKLRIIFEMLVGECFDDPTLPSGAAIRVEEYAINFYHPLEAVFPLHDDKIREELEGDFGVSAIMYPGKESWMGSLKEIRNYYGEEIAFYFAFLRFYNFALLFPGAIGIVAFIAQMAQGEVAFAGIIALAIIVICWSVVFVEFWVKKEKSYAKEWGMSRFARKDVPRPQFTGITVPSPVTGKLVEEYRVVQEHYCRMCITYDIVIFCVCTAAVSVGALFLWRDSLQDSPGYSVMIGCLNGLMIQIFNVIYALLCFYLNEWENHRLQPEWDNSTIWKKVLFALVNSYISLVYVGFLRDGYTNEETLQELRIQLISLFGTMIVVQNLTELVINDIINFIFSLIPGFVVPEYEGFDDIVHEQVQNHVVPPEDLEDAEEQIELDPSPELIDQMIELIIQYGYLTLFVIVFPLAPILAFVNNILEISVDTYNWKTAQRPIPRGAMGIGTWNSILMLFSLLAVATNTLIIALKTDNVSEITNCEADKCGEDKVWFIVVVSGICYGFILLVKVFVPDVALEVKEHLLRSEEIEKYLVMKAIKPSLFNESHSNLSKNEAKMTKYAQTQCAFTKYLAERNNGGGEIEDETSNKRSPEYNRKPADDEEENKTFIGKVMDYGRSAMGMEEDEAEPEPEPEPEPEADPEPEPEPVVDDEQVADEFEEEQ